VVVEAVAALTGAARHAMMLTTDELRVILVTTHVSLRTALEQITEQRVYDVVALADAELRRLGVAAPRVAVAGANPHAGEHGMFGTEEAERIAPAIAKARADGIDATGPWPGDTVFMRARRGEFDVVVAQYHDQGLIPVKLLGIDDGVNITVGLPFVRTSVDHGSAYDIAGTGTASPASLTNALRAAARLVARSE
jgi:4-hydroxythreonine-4-phosphate dehydrogenase